VVGRRHLAPTGVWRSTALRAIGPVLSCNTGDWVEICSALAEREDGTLTLLAFAERARAVTARRGGSG